VEPELEDEAAQSAAPWRVLLQVTLPRVRASVLAAALFVVLQTASEISVTDIFLVQTLAEEAFTQFAVGHSGLGRTLALSLPGLLLAWSVVLLIVARLEKSLPPLAPPARGHRTLDLGWPAARFSGAALVLFLLIVPLGSLVWKLGLTGHPARWGASSAGHFLQNEARLLGKDLTATLATSLATGFLVAGIALWACWLARDARWFRWVLFSIVVGAWVMPGPVVGIGLHEIILSLPEGPWKDALYYGPSPLPLMWVQAIRALPIAVVFLWPIVRLLPRELFDEARLAGAGALGPWLGVLVPMTGRAGLIAALAASALCLGEVAASTRVETPGWDSFTKLVLNRMHFGVDNNVSALCVLMLASLGVIALAALGLTALARMVRRER
jgi:iron(III) transport system permease protein